MLFDVLKLSKKSNIQICSFVYLHRCFDNSKNIYSNKMFWLKKKLYMSIQHSKYCTNNNNILDRGHLSYGVPDGMGCI